MFKRILGDKVPQFKNNETDDFLITGDRGMTLMHDVFDVDIAGHVDKISKSRPTAGSRSKDLFAIVTGTGRGKTRTLIEIKKEINKKPTSFSLAITFNHLWANIIAEEGMWNNKLRLPSRFIYAVNIVARIISMNYRISYGDTKKLLYTSVSSLSSNDTTDDDASSFINECVQFIVEQYRVKYNHPIQEFVLLVDESVSIHEKLGLKEQYR
jgi:hypothetical protein